MIDPIPTTFAAGRTQAAPRVEASESARRQHQSRGGQTSPKLRRRQLDEGDQANETRQDRKRTDMYA